MSEYNKKIACFECLNLIDIEDKKPFEMVTCCECKKSVCVTQKAGDWIFTERLSHNDVYSTFKGHKSGKSAALVFKIIHSEEFGEEKFKKLEAAQVKLPENCGLKSAKTDEYFLFYRPFFETSLDEYLKTSRPRSAKAVAIMKEAAEILQKTVKNNVYPVSIPVGNLLMDEFGKTVLSDLTFRQDLQKLLGKNDLLEKKTVSQKYFTSGTGSAGDTVFAFAALSQYLCSGNYPDTKKEWKLDLRDEIPKGLESLIKCLTHKKNPLTTLNEVIYKIGEIQKGDYREIDLPKEDKAVKEKPKTAVKAKSKTQLKNVPGSAVIARRRKKTSSNSVAAIAVVLIVIIGLLAVSALSGQNSPEKKIAKAKPAKHKPHVKKRAVKPVKKAPVLNPVNVSKPVAAAKPVTAIIEKEPEPVVNIADIKAELVPSDFNFDRLNPVIDEYLSASESRDLEGERIDIVSTYRDHILYHFDQRLYTGIFHIEGMKLFRGTVKMANEEKIQITDLNSGKETLISWDKLKFEQFMEFADYYAAAYSDRFSISDDNTAIFKKIADEYKRLAVFLDWYGKKENALSYKKKALKFDREVEKALEKMLTEGAG